jgi:hypothetical protein
LISSEVAGAGGTVVVVVVGMVVVVGGIVVVVVVGVMAGVVEFWTVKLTAGEAYARPADVKPVAFTLCMPSATVVEFQERR